MNVLDDLALAVLADCRSPLCVLDGKGGLLAVSHGARQVLGCPDPSASGLDIMATLGLSLADLTTAGQASVASGVPARLGCAAWPLTDGQAIQITLRVRENPQPGRWKWLLYIDSLAESLEDVCDIESHFRTIIDTITDGVIVIDAVGIIQLVNPAVEMLFGYPRQELIGRNIKMLMPSPDRERHDHYLRQYCRTGVRNIIGVGREVRGMRKDGTVFPFALSVGELGNDGPHRFVGIIHDLGPRRVVEEKLTLLSSAIEQAPTGIVITNLAGEVEYINAGFTKLTGYLPEDVLGQGLFSSGSVLASVAQNAPLCWRLLSVRHWQGEIKDYKKSGEAYWASVTFSPIQDEHGVAIRLLGRLQDVTQRKLDQEALAESEGRFREVARMVGEWLWEQDPAGHYTYSSSAVEDILGYRPDEIVGRHYMDFLTEVDRLLWTDATPEAPRVTASFRKLINHYRHRDGHEVFTESTGTPLLNEQGEVIKWRGMDLDITERKHAEDALRLRERAIEAASVGIAIADASQPNYPNIYVNSALCRITGYDEHELLGRSLRMLQGKGSDEACREKIRKSLQSGKTCEVTIRNYRKDGSSFWNELLLSPVQDEKGRITHWIGIIADVSERRRAEDERHELEIARQIQTSLLPKAPLRLGHVEVAGVCVPATQVGGDYYDFICHGEYIDLVIADVSGHSVGAALIMAEMRSTLKGELRRSHASSVSTAHLLHALNELLYADLDGAELFISMFYLRYHRKTRELRYSSAGHNPPLLLRKDAPACFELDADGLILGVSRHVSFDERQLKLESGDRLLLYTDGATDTQNDQGEYFGERRLCRAFTAQRDLPPEVTLDNLLDQLRDFRGGIGFVDDISMVALTVH